MITEAMSAVLASGSSASRDTPVGLAPRLRLVLRRDLA